MSRRKKLVPEPIYEPVRFVELGDKHKQLIGEPPSGRVFVGTPTLPAQPLTAKERAGIAAQDAGLATLELDICAWCAAVFRDDQYSEGITVGSWRGL